MLGKIVVGDVDPKSVEMVDPASLNLVKEVSIKVGQKKNFKTHDPKVYNNRKSLFMSFLFFVK